MHDKMHEHAHDHSHPHVHGGDARSGIGARTAAVLEYMLAHNEQHADELADIADGLRGTGPADAVAGLDAAVLDLRSGDAKLAEALRIFKEVL
jgi:hypothetical protein